MPLRLVAASPDPQLLTLPWQTPLEGWPDNLLVSLPRGISRHVVRFVRVGSQVYAIKETREPIAWREYRMLRDLQRLGLAVVEALGVLTGRTASDGSEIEPVLITKHLPYSQPYRALFSHRMRDDTVILLRDALVVLLVRLHLAGFFWGDCSLSNTLFRRSAGTFAAYLVDAETGELHDQISDGQRNHDLDIAVTNLFGELLDLQAGELLHPGLDPWATVEGLEETYRGLWSELTATEEFEAGDIWRIEQRIRRLNELGFDVGELDIVTDLDGATIRIRPQVVDAGHHRRRLHRLTGLDVEDNQARRLLNDLDAFTASHELQGEDESIVAHRWVTDVFEPIVAAVPPTWRGELEPAEIFHEILEHRWFLSENTGEEVDIFDAAQAYAKDIAQPRASQTG
jgi:Domain of unknown function (DUF4032)/Lipopolysaccharide kinase (Kdo/WaaP) family